MTETDHFRFGAQDFGAFTKAPASLREHHLPDRERGVATSRNHDDLVHLVRRLVPAPRAPEFAQRETRRHISMCTDTLHLAPLLNVENTHASVPMANTQQDFAFQSDIDGLRMRKRIGVDVNFEHEPGCRLWFERVRS